MPETTARIAVLLLAGAFSWAAIAKLLTYRRWRAVLARYGLPSGIDAVAAPVVPGVEGAIAATLVAMSPRIGAAAALATLSLFCLAILRARSINGDRLPCGCFGGAEERHYRTMMWRNGALGAMAGAVLVAQPEPRLSAPSLPGSDELVAAALVVVGATLAIWTVAKAMGALRGRPVR